MFDITFFRSRSLIKKLIYQNLGFSRGCAEERSISKSSMAMDVGEMEAESCLMNSHGPIGMITNMGFRNRLQV